jgi:hypothetical protein
MMAGMGDGKRHQYKIEEVPEKAGK